MDRVTRFLAAVSLAATGSLVAGCSAGDAPPAGETVATAVPTAMTTTSTPVAGPAGDVVEIPLAVAERWSELGGAEGVLGPVAGPTTEVGPGSVTDFERGMIVLTPQGRAFVVQGEILTAYRETGGPAGELGFPTADEATTDGGWISTFERGSITHIGGVTAVEPR